MNTAQGGKGSWRWGCYVRGQKTRLYLGSVEALLSSSEETTELCAWTGVNPEARC